MAGLPSTLHKPALELFYGKHDSARLCRIDRILREHKFPLLCKLLAGKYGDGPVEMWEAALAKAVVQHDYPGDGSGDSLSLKQGQRVCIIARDQPTRGWCRGYIDLLKAPKIGCFPSSFVGQGNPDVPEPRRQIRPLEAEEPLEYGVGGERMPADRGRGVCSHWGPSGAAPSKAAAAAPAHGDLKWASYRYVPSPPQVNRCSAA
jgi:hypothetical protein